MPFKSGDFQLVVHLWSSRHESQGVVPLKRVSGINVYVVLRLDFTLLCRYIGLPHFSFLPFLSLKPMYDTT